MSRLIDKLNQVSRAVPQPMGFRATQATSLKPKMLLIASLAEVDINGLADYIAGADAGLLPVSDLTSGAETLRKICQVVPDVPLGGWLGSIDSEESEQIERSCSDFVVFRATNSSLGILQRKGVGKILQVEASLDEGLLAAIDELPVDAVLITTEPGEHFITWHDLMIFRYFAGLLTKPIIAVVPSDVEADELKTIWEAGVNGVVLKAGENLQKLRQTIDNMNFPPQRKRGRVEAILPHTVGEVDSEEED